jgi:TrmH family RNA methyltransferase
VREALAADAVLELFATADALVRHPELTARASEISVQDAAALSETVTPQGLVAVCSLAQPTLSEVLLVPPRLVVLLVEPNDPGNLGTVIRTADAAGADAVLLDGGVDPYNGKAVRASAGSLFHLPVLQAAGHDVLAAAEQAGVQVLATTGSRNGDTDDIDDLLDAGVLARPSVWVFGTEAHGLPDPLLQAADRRVRIPIHGRAESLNLASCAAVCLYASARAQRRA